MKQIALIICLLFAANAGAQTFSDDASGSTDTRCFSAPSGTTVKYSVTCAGIYGFGCSFSLALKDCKTGGFTGTSAFVRAKDGQNKKGSLVIRRSGKYYLRAVMGGPWSAKIKKPAKR